jgi:hypothetical protein
MASASPSDMLPQNRRARVAIARHSNRFRMTTAQC